MSELVTEQTARFLRATTPPGDEVVQEMEAYGETHGPTAVGPVVGQFLRVLTELTDATRVFEFGSGYGYSAYWFARGGADVVLTDVDAGSLSQAREFFEQGDRSDSATFEVGDAHDVVDEYDGPFDIVLLDHQKERYPEALTAVRDKVAAGGVVVADNAMVSTSIQFEALAATLDGEHRELNDATNGIATYLQTVRADDAFDTTVLPVGEGVAVSRKRA